MTVALKLNGNISNIELQYMFCFFKIYFLQLKVGLNLVFTALAECNLNYTIGSLVKHNFSSYKSFQTASDLTIMFFTIDPGSDSLQKV